ncbi:MAG: hypothetical protein WAX69_10375 [Victivallales bacterium]
MKQKIKYSFAVLILIFNPIWISNVWAAGLLTSAMYDGYCHVAIVETDKLNKSIWNPFNDDFPFSIVNSHEYSRSKLAELTGVDFKEFEMTEISMDNMRENRWRFSLLFSPASSESLKFYSVYFYSDGEPLVLKKEKWDKDSKNGFVAKNYYNKNVKSWDGKYDKTIICSNSINKRVYEYRITKDILDNNDKWSYLQPLSIPIKTVLERAEKEFRRTYIGDSATKYLMSSICLHRLFETEYWYYIISYKTENNLDKSFGYLHIPITISGTIIVPEEKTQGVLQPSQPSTANTPDENSFTTPDDKVK